MKSPFNSYKYSDRYKHWRNKKLHNLVQFYDSDIHEKFILINDASSLNAQESKSILEQCLDHNFCLYRVVNHTSATKKNIHQLAKQLGISKLDNNICADNDKLTSITRAPHKGQHDYIPYSNKRLSWHTDGYYNPPDKKINSMLLHCSQPAKEGGTSLIIDHEIVYMLLRDENPHYIKALMHPDAMTIPANILDGKVIRPTQSGPVFSINSQGGLHMRFSARKKNIEWNQNSPTLEAIAFLEELLNSDSRYLIKYTLNEGEGLICRNILHRRTSFVDSDNPVKKRLLYRGRYFDHINKP